MGGNRSGATAGSHGAPARPSGSPASPRHRYVRDGEVQVVHAPLGRQIARPDPSLQQDKALIETLRQDLERERAAREAAERSLHEARASLTTLQTRYVHIEMDLQEAQEQAQEKAQEQASEKAAAEAAAGAEPAVTEFKSAPERVRRRPRAEKPARTPQPIKWWIKAE